MRKKKILKNIVISLFALAAACAISPLFQWLGVEEHITTIFVFSVFIVSLCTDGYLYGIVSAVIGTVAINFAFTYPFLKLSLFTFVCLMYQQYNDTFHELRMQLENQVVQIP